MQFSSSQTSSIFQKVLQQHLRRNEALFLNFWTICVNLSQTALVVNAFEALISVCIVQFFFSDDQTCFGLSHLRLTWSILNICCSHFSVRLKLHLLTTITFYFFFQLKVTEYVLDENDQLMPMNRLHGENTVS